MPVPGDSVTVNVADWSSVTSVASAATVAVSVFLSAMVPVALAVVTDTPSGRLSGVAVSHTLKVSVASFRPSSRVATSIVLLVSVAAKVRVPRFAV